MKATHIEFDELLLVLLELLVQAHSQEVCNVNEPLTLSLSTTHFSSYGVQCMQLTHI